MPVSIYVSKGVAGNPPYKFFLDENGSQELTKLTLDPTKSYLFKRLDNTTKHPFYISDVGYKKSSSNKISLTGDGSATSGIIGNQSILLSFNEGSANLGQLHFFLYISSKYDFYFQYWKFSIRSDFLKYQSIKL